MRGSMRKALVTVMAAASVATTMAAPSVTRPMPGTAAAPQRSGTIIGSGDISGNLPCGLAPDCAAWLQSGCDPALAGHDPAWLTSIVDVSDLADGTTRRVLSTRRTLWRSGVYIQLWRGNCDEIGECASTRWSPSTEPWRDWDRPLGCHRAEIPPSRWAWGDPLIIPRRARWMTISASSAVNTVWTLR